MNIEQLKKSGWIIYEVISGSHAYGTNIPGSDIDKRGIFILPTIMLLSDDYIEQVSDDNNDTTYYEIGRFIKLAREGNPNILDLLNTPEDCILYKDPLFSAYFPDPSIFLTTKLRHTFTGYAHSQIKKAKGLKKKINWDQTQMVRKTPLDFCYYALDRERTINLNELLSRKNTQILGNTLFHGGLKQEELGLASVNNFPDIYSVYYLESGGGIIGDDSNDVQLRSIPKDAAYLGIIRFDRNGYSTHCRDFREYTKWLEERNPERYKDNLKGEQGFDHKNMMHCVRLLYTALDVANGKGLIIRRPERDYLLSIRNGEASYDHILDQSEKLIEEINSAFDNSTLPREVPIKYIRELLFKIRMDNLNK